MRSLLTLFACSLIGCVSTQAQSFNYLPSQHMLDTVETNGYSAQYMNIVPFDSSDIQLKWKLVTNTLAQDWSVSLCDYPNCFTTIPDSALMNPVSAAQLQGGLNPFFQLLVSTKDDEVTGVLELFVYDVNNDSVGDTVSFTLTAVAPEEDTTGASGIVALRTNEAVSVYPNPAQGIATVSALELEKVQLLDLSGKLIQTVQVIADQSAQLDMQALSPGTYMVISTTKTGIHHTRLVKQ